MIVDHHLHIHLNLRFVLSVSVNLRNTHHTIKGHGDFMSSWMNSSSPLCPTIWLDLVWELRHQYLNPSYYMLVNTTQSDQLQQQATTLTLCAEKNITDTAAHILMLPIVTIRIRCARASSCALSVSSIYASGRRVHVGKTTISNENTGVNHVNQ